MYKIFSMDNPWKEVALSDYENHMSLSNVYQLQTLDAIMRSQFESYPVVSAAILGVAGGNGLGNLIAINNITSIYGIDINASYLSASKERYPELAKRYRTILADINDDISILPQADLVIANLFIEYVGCSNFANAIKQISPSFISCVIQIDPAESFVSESPYTDKLETLDTVHSSVNPNELIENLESIGYKSILEKSTSLPNGKMFMRLDFAIE